MISNHLQSIITLATLLLGVVSPLPVSINGRSLEPNAAVADDINGVSILMKGQAETLPLIKNTFLLLSNPVDYYNGMKNCQKMGEGTALCLPLPPARLSDPLKSWYLLPCRHFLSSPQKIQAVTSLTLEQRERQTSSSCSFPMPLPTKKSKGLIGFGCSMVRYCLSLLF